MHYNDNYFQGQKLTDGFGGNAELFKFRSFVNQDDTVLDFGCGAGGVLKNLNCKRRLGVDLNSSAREYAKSQGIEVFESIEQLPEQVIDVAISNHALEHVLSPYDVLVNLRRKLKSTSRVVFVVPHDCRTQQWHINDQNMHIYTWNRMTLGNLFVMAGYAVAQVDVIHHCWPSYYKQIHKLIGHKWCHRLGYLEARLRGRSQVRIVARPGNEPDPMKMK